MIKNKYTTLSTLGYSLIELSITLALLGIILGTGLSIGEEQVEDNAVETLNEKLDVVEEALRLFSNHHGRLPCPANLNDSENDATFGAEDDCSNATPTSATGILTNAPSADEIWIGAIPTRTLGLPERYMTDSWNNRITYVVRKDIATDGASLETITAAGLGSMIQIMDRQGNQINPDDVNNPVLYLLLSHGKDKQGGYNRAGGVTGQTVACRTAPSPPNPEPTIDTENCNNDNVFVDVTLSDSQDASQYFYDFVRWRTRLHVTQPTPPGTDSQLGSDGFFFPLYAVREHTCIIASNGAVMCAGEPDDGKLGNNDDSTPQTSFVAEANNFTDWVIIRGDNNSNCGIRTNGEAYCWGENNAGQIGDGTTTNALIPTKVIGGHTKWTSIDADQDHSCGISNGRAYCWGDSSYGRLGNDLATGDMTQPTIVGGGYTDWLHINVGRYHSCGVRQNGRAYCWGRNNTGQLGDNDAGSSKELPEEVDGDHTDWSYIHTSSEHTCGIRNGGELYCWGENDDGKLGANLGTGGSRDTPQLVSGGITDWTYVWAGSHNTCALHGSGEAYCWGRNDNNQLGLAGGAGASEDEPQPVDPGLSITDWKFIGSQGENFGCAVRESGALYCWGRNEHGAFGDGGASLVEVGPTEITGISVKVSGN